MPFSLDQLKTVASPKSNGGFLLSLSPRIKIYLGIGVMLLIVGLAWNFKQRDKLKISASTSTAAIQADSLVQKKQALQQLLSQGEGLLALGEFDRAVTLLVQGLEQHPNHKGVLLKLALAYQGGENHEAADKTYQKVLQLDAQCTLCLNNRAVLLLQRGRLAEASASLEQALAQKEDYAEAWLNLGIVQDQAKQYRQALGSYEKYLSLLTAGSSETESALVRERIRELKGE